MNGNDYIPMKRWKNITQAKMTSPRGNERKGIKMIRLTGLWKKSGKDGETYLTGNVGLGRFLIMPNAYKKNEKDPDYHLLVATNQKKEDHKQPPKKGEL